MTSRPPSQRYYRIGFVPNQIREPSAALRGLPVVGGRRGAYVPPEFSLAAQPFSGGDRPEKNSIQPEEESAMAFELSSLPYAYDDLAPYMSKETLEFHHDKHHQAYVTNGNNLLKGSGLEDKDVEEVVKQSYSKNAGLFNNAGQHYNHIHFWQWMKKGGGGKSLPAIRHKAHDNE